MPALAPAPAPVPPGEEAVTLVVPVRLADCVPPVPPPAPVPTPDVSPEIPDVEVPPVPPAPPVVTPVDAPVKVLMPPEVATPLVPAPPPYHEPRLELRAPPPVVVPEGNALAPKELMELGEKTPANLLTAESIPATSPEARAVSRLFEKPLRLLSRLPSNVLAAAVAPAMSRLLTRLTTSAIELASCKEIPDEPSVTCFALSPSDGPSPANVARSPFRMASET